MKLMYWLRLSAVGLLAAAGCYPERWTGNFEHLQDIAELSGENVEMTALDATDEARRQTRLAELEKMPDPPFTINAGDELKIVVYNHPDLDNVITVTPDGKIGMVFLGEVTVAGLTLAQAAQKIEDGLSKYIKKPAVSVNPLRISSQTATIAGAVGSPGMYPIANGMRLSDLFALAHGSSIRRYDGQDLDAADFTHSYFVRNGDIVNVDFRAALEHGAPLENIRLRKGDYVYVAVRSESIVTIIGSVPAPTKRMWEKGMGLIEFLATAGWMKEEAWSHVIIIRGGTIRPVLYKVNVANIVSGKAPNVALEAGDVIYVPKDNISEYNVFVRKLLPTAQLVNLLTSRVTAFAN